MNPKIYLVGGAVRDLILGKPPKDLDYVVVGADLQWMLDRGFKQVGAAFPVFLHPETGDEYAMARREKKVAPGYQGFEFEFGPDVTLAQDLSRRDLTMNSIAFCETTNTYIDPFNGRSDLLNGIIRHTSEAFAEDPLRVLRTARFAARYQFSIAQETQELCRQLVQNGELDALSPERIWAELEKMFSETYPDIGLIFLDNIGALSTKRLDGLVFSPPINYRLLYNNDVESTMSVIQKMYFGLNLADLSKPQLEQFRVPSHISRECKFYSAIYDVADDFMNGRNANVALPRIVQFFDQYREEFKGKKHLEVRDFMKKCTDQDYIFCDFFGLFSFLVKFDNAIEALIALDFTELVKNLKPSEIKGFVLDTKINVVKIALGVK